MQSMQFSKLTPSNLELVLAMNKSFRSHFACERNAQKFLSHPMNWLFACIMDDQIIGFAYGYEMNRIDSQGNMLYIHEVGVLPEYHRKGIGYQLLTELKSACTLNNISKLFLITQEKNLAACALYEKAGGEKNNDLQDADVTYFFKLGE